MQPNMDYTMGFPLKIYLDFISTGADQQPGDFNIEVAFVKYDPDEETSTPAANVIVV